MPRLPRLTGTETLRILRRAGWQTERVRGSHHILRHSGRAGATVTIPVHAGEILKPKTLSTILDQAGLTIEEFVALM